MQEREIRFSIANDEEKIRAATWVVCSNKNSSDVYIACRELKSAIKVSLHESNEWRLAYDYQFYTKKVAEDVPRNKDRIIHKWKKADPLVQGITLALRIVTPHTAVCTGYDELNGIELIEPTPNCDATEIGVFISEVDTLESDWPAKNSLNSKLIGKYQLPNESIVWLVSWGCGLPDFSSLPKKFNYFKGVSKSDVGESLRAMVFGDHPDGSKVLYDIAGKKA